MRFVIVGAGAIGGFLGAYLARAGADVTLIARGAHLAAMRERGLRVEGREESFIAHPRCTDSLDAVSGAEAIFLTLKAHSLPRLAPALAPKLRDSAVVLPAQNGIPWWYFNGAGGPLEATRLESVDPGGVIAASIPIARVVGCIAYPAARLLEPGIIEHVEGNRFTLGEPDGTRSERTLAISKALAAAGLKAPVQTRIRQEIWLKLLGNATLNPLSALTRATLADLTSDAGARGLIEELMGEVASVARAVGEEIEIDVRRRLEGAARVGEHRTSMLQDVEAGRPLEIDALVGAVVELGDRLHLELPRMRTLHTCVRLLDQSLRTENEQKLS